MKRLRFLRGRERLSAPELRVILGMEYCNVSSGFPVWRIDYANK